MIMDVLRSCSRQKIRFVAGDLAAEEVATWYFAAPTAKAFPEPHAFSSPVWDTIHPMTTAIGFNANASRSYYNGKRTNSSKGQSYAGPLRFFQEGCDEPANLARAMNGTPLQCLDLPAGFWFGGQSVKSTLVSGGTLSGGVGFTPSVPLDCSLVPVTIHCLVLTGTGPFATFVGLGFDTIKDVFGHWTGGVFSGPDLLSLDGQCIAGTWFQNGLYNGLTPIGSASTSLSPVAFVGSFGLGSDTLTIQFSE